MPVQEIGDNLVIFYNRLVLLYTVFIIFVPNLKVTNYSMPLHVMANFGRFPCECDLEGYVSLLIMFVGMRCDAAPSTC